MGVSRSTILVFDSVYFVLSFHGRFFLTIFSLLLPTFRHFPPAFSTKSFDNTEAPDGDITLPKGASHLNLSKYFGSFRLFGVLF